ncbi:MAG: GSU2203 family decaheme c-type cytochrome [bacterium]
MPATPRKRARACARAGPRICAALLTLLPGIPAFAYEVDSFDARAAAYVDDAACLECHEEYAASTTVHRDLEEFETAAVVTRGCQSCHGPGSLHVESNDPDDIRNPATADPVVANRACLQCHRADDVGAFEMSLHAAADVSCVSCHDIHGPQRGALLRSSQPDLCVSCHQDQRASMYLPSHHPVREGRMTCTDCHDPHGSTPSAASAGRPNDLCLSCHARHAGPFIFEHSPVIEDCTICHAPHGSVANALLVQNEPFLCLQCHQAHFHATIPGIDGEFTSLDGYSAVSTHDASKRGFLTKCTQCHTEIHGSDLPSQSISGQGAALTR